LVSPTHPIFDISKTTYIRDGMALLQSVDAKKYRNFGELAMDFPIWNDSSFDNLKNFCSEERLGPTFSFRTFD
jgi:hypothetical protein